MRLTTTLPLNKQPVCQEQNNNRLQKQKNKRFSKKASTIRRDIGTKSLDACTHGCCSSSTDSPG